MRITIAGACGALAVAIVCSEAFAAPIGLLDFSGNEALETFDTFPSAIPAATPQTVNGLTFQSQGSGGGASGMFRIDSVFHSNLFLNIAGTSGAPVFQDNFTLSDFTIAFSTPVRRVGILLSTGPATSWRVSSLDQVGGLIEFVEVSMFADNEAVFAGLETSTIIASLRIQDISPDNGSVTFMDDLRFEAIPELSTALLTGLGIVGLAIASRNRSGRGAG